MGRYDAHKNPFSYRMNEWASHRVNNHEEVQPKTMPAYVQKVEKDFVHVAFEPRNNIFTLPVVKMPQSMSGYGRDPTQKGDFGYAVPGTYYMGSVSGFGGGGTSFYPRANLTTLSFQPVSNLGSVSRDYDQNTQTGGPHGWVAKVMDQTGEQSTQIAGDVAETPATATVSRAARNVMAQRNFVFASRLAIAQPMDTATPPDFGQDPQSPESSSQQSDQTMFQFDQNGLCTIQSKDTKYNVTMDNQNQKATVNVPIDAMIYIGGDGKTGTYAPIMTVQGPVKNAKGRIS